MWIFSIWGNELAEALTSRSPVLTLNVAFLKAKVNLVSFTSIPAMKTLTWYSYPIGIAGTLVANAYYWFPVTEQSYWFHASARKTPA